MLRKLKVTIESTEDGYSGYIELNSTLIIGFGDTILEIFIDLILGLKFYIES
jgi:hypothetical protein